MTGCHTCGGFGDRHDPVAHGTETVMTETCTCGPGAWGTCDQCGVDAWVKHHCPFPCDDVTCENGSICIGCLTGRPCPMHNGDDWADEDDAWDEADYRRDGDQALAALAASIRDYSREGAE